MIYGYIRVSTDKQTVENQRFEIKRFCAQEMMNIDGWIEESVSGTRNYRPRVDREGRISSGRRHTEQGARLCLRAVGRD